MSEFFEDDGYYTGPPLNGEMVHQAEDSLGVRLPSAFVDLLYRRNGGTPKRRCYATAFPTSWAPDHIEISGIRGIGGEWGVDSTTGLGNADMIAEWGYPQVGVVICDMPSAGHDTVMLDYTESGPEGEPAVVYVDEDRIPKRIAGSFEEFIANLMPCDRFSSPDAQ